MKSGCYFLILLAPLGLRWPRKIGQLFKVYSTD